jgi:REP element-mobilizing transposase RayT
MNKKDHIHHRRSIRLKGYDYSQAGIYFITICIQKKNCLFGEILNGKILLNDAGKMVASTWIKMPKQFNFVVLDQYIVMPNHIHGIIIITNVRAPLVGAQNNHNRIKYAEKNNSKKAGTRPASTFRLGSIIGAFKSITTLKYINGVKNDNWKPFNKKLWQRNYYEHIIRNEYELHNIRLYIINNPIKWEIDKQNPINRHISY